MNYIHLQDYLRRLVVSLSNYVSDNMYKSPQQSEQKLSAHFVAFSAFFVVPFPCFLYATSPPPPKPFLSLLSLLFLAPAIIRTWGEGVK